MKITRLETIPVCVPLKAGLTTKTAHGEHVVSRYVIVRLHTDAGPIGLGEATLAPRWTGETSESCVAILRDLVEPAIVGQNPFDINRLRQTIDRAVKLNPFTKAAVEMALWDVLGRATGQPVYRFLGGKVRDAAPIKMVVGAFPPTDAARLARRFLEWGAACLKVKVGLNVDDDVARVRAVRDVAGAGVSLTIDGNCGWSLADARRALRLLEDCDLVCAEQPIAAGDPQAWAELRRHATVPLMADESVFTLADAWQLAAHRAVDVLSVYPGKHGGIAGTVEIVHVAQAAGMACAIGGNLELGIGTAAMLHVAASLRQVDSERFPADAIGPLYHECDLLVRPLQLGPKVALIPDGPGLGVELDLEKLARWRER